MKKFSRNLQDMMRPTAPKGPVTRSQAKTRSRSLDRGLQQQELENRRTGTFMKEDYDTISVADNSSSKSESSESSITTIKNQETLVMRSTARPDYITLTEDLTGKLLKATQQAGAIETQAEVHEGPERASPTDTVKSQFDPNYIAVKTTGKTRGITVPDLKFPRDVDLNMFGPAITSVHIPEDKLKDLPNDGRLFMQNHVQMSVYITDAFNKYQLFKSLSRKLQKEFRRTKEGRKPKRSLEELLDLHSKQKQMFYDWGRQRQAAIEEMRSIKRKSDGSNYYDEDQIARMVKGVMSPYDDPENEAAMREYANWIADLEFSSSAKSKAVRKRKDKYRRVRDESSTDDSSSDDSSSGSDETTSSDEEEDYYRKKKSKKKARKKSRKKKEEPKRRMEFKESFMPELQEKASGHEAKIFLNLFRALLSRYVHEPSFGLAILSNKIKKLSLKSRVLTADHSREGIEQAIKWIEREYQADDVSIQMYFRMELDKVTHVKNSYADCDKLVQLLENCANEDSFRFYMEDEDSTQWLNLFDALPEEFKTELEYSGRPPNLTNLLDFLTIKMKYLQKRKMIRDNRGGQSRPSNSPYKSNHFRSSKPAYKPTTKVFNHATSFAEEKKKESAARSNPKFHGEQRAKVCHVCRSDRKETSAQSEHLTDECERLTKLKPKERLEYIDKLRLCRICLKWHKGECYDSKKKCDRCTQIGHHKLLCFTNLSGNETKKDKVQMFNHNSEEVVEQNEPKRLLPEKYSSWVFTCVAKSPKTGKETKVNIMTDGGATESWVLDETANFLNLPVLGKGDVQVTTANAVTMVKQTPIVPIRLVNLDGSYGVDFNIRAMPREVIPQVSVVNNEKLVEDFPEMEQFPTHDVGDGTIHMVLGQDHENLILYEKVEGLPKDGPKVAIFPLGHGFSCPMTWLNKHIESSSDESSEEVEDVKSYRIATKSVSEMLYEDVLDKNSTKDPALMNQDELSTHYLKKIVDQDDVSVKVEIKHEDKKVLEATEETAIFEEGRYTIKIPWKPDQSKPKNNYHQERIRIEKMRKNLAKTPERWKMYEDTIREELAKAYVEEVIDDNPDKGEVYYLMHLPVWRLDKETTKCRKVNNGSLKDYLGNSLNNAIFAGPDLTNKLINIGLKFRKGKYAWISDCAEFFPQIKLFDEDKDFFRFLWFNKDGKVCIYRYRRLLFGLNCSPFLAQFVSIMGAHKHKESHLYAYQTILENRYVDDLAFSHDDKAIAIKALLETQHVMQTIGVKLHKTLANDPDIMLAIDQEARLKKWVEDEELPNSSVLGMPWNLPGDYLTISLSNIPTQRIRTKREFLQVLAGQFDPLGFICPFLIVAKLILQKMWSKGITWDESLPDDLAKETNEWTDQLKDLKDLKIPRHVVDGKVIGIHGYCDSSDVAMAACIYVLTEDGKTGLVTAKARVHSLKPRSIQQKELMGAVLLSQLLIEVKKVYPGVEITLWTDSTTTLAWIATDDPRKHVTFVHNRVGTIRENTEINWWRHVDSKNNAADPASRGLSLKELLECELYWQASRYLRDDSLPWPAEKKFLKTDQDLKKKYKVEEVFINFARVKHVPNPKDFVSFQEMKVATAKNLKKEEQDDSALTVEDLQRAENHIIYNAQIESFNQEYQDLENSQQVAARSKLANARPFLDENKVMRSNSKLVNAENLDYDTRYPIILPKNKTLTILIIKDAHEKSQHTYALNWTVDELKKKYYIPSCRQQVKKFLRGCRECKRNFGRPRHAVMAPLPKLRVDSPMKSFWNCGVDFAGPFYTIVGRGQTRYKRWLCLFTCLYTRAIHCEIAYGMETSDFFNCLNNFIARRGKIRYIWSDNGTNFRGAQTEIRQLLDQLSTDELQEHLAENELTFKFNTPNAPHQGGVWESLVKSSKRAIFNILKTQDFTDGQLIAAFTQAENIINSRPLGYVSSDPNDHRVITPNMLITGRLDGFQMPPNVDTTDFHPRQKWRMIQDIQKQVWKRFLREILPNLGVRQKWTRDQRNYQVGDEVLIIDPTIRRYKWLPGRITQVHPGRDGIVRNVDVRTEQGELLQKTVHRLIPLT